MATVLDVAAYVLDYKGPMTAWKLQKLVYYCQAWSLVWDERPLFHARIEAWANGPVIPKLYKAHRGQFVVKVIGEGDPDNLTDEEVDTVDAVLKAYGGKSSQWLKDLTHSERPWCEARAGMRAGERGSKEITHEAMSEYYGSL